MHIMNGNPKILNKMKIKFILLSLIFLIETCGIGDPPPPPVEYDNLMIYSDLSSRMIKTPNDRLIIDQLLNYFVKDCVKPGLKINDRSSIRFSRVNSFDTKCLQSKIDIGEIKSLEEKQKFVNNTSSNFNNLSDALSQFKKSINCNYTEKDSGGLDILSLIYNEISNGNNIKKPEFIYGEYDTTVVNFNNRLFIFTDGYLEYSKKDGSEDFYFGQENVEQVRTYCKNNKVTVEDAIKNNELFRLRPLKSDNNKYVQLYILETYDRGINPKRGTVKNSGDLSDNNILRLVWKNWAAESGFKSFTWKQMIAGSSMPSDYIKQVINN